MSDGVGGTVGREGLMGGGGGEGAKGFSGFSITPAPCSGLPPVLVKVLLHKPNTT